MLTKVIDQDPLKASASSLEDMVVQKHISFVHLSCFKLAFDAAATQSALLHGRCYSLTRVLLQIHDEPIPTSGWEV